MAVNRFSIDGQEMTSTRAEIEKHTTASFSLTYEIGSPLFYVIVVGAGSILLIAYLAILAWILTLVYLRCCRHTSHRQSKLIKLITRVHVLIKFTYTYVSN